MKKTLSKRIRVTKNGKIIRRHMGIGHNGSRRSQKQKRRTAGHGLVHKVDGQSITRSFLRVSHFKKATRSNR